VVAGFWAPSKRPNSLPHSNYRTNGGAEKGRCRRPTLKRHKGKDKDLSDGRKTWLETEWLALTGLLGRVM
jgi:hypothetical protein